MSTVQQLKPGDVVDSTPGLPPAVFVSTSAHPLYPGLQLVTWRLADGSWSHDALRADQHVGEARPADFAERQNALRRALQGDPR